MLMKIAINCGHTLVGKGSGAAGFINESKENRSVGGLVISMLRDLGHTVIDCTVDKSDKYLEECVALANKQSVDLAVSIHFNAGGGTGTETLIYSGSNPIATRINNEIVKLGFVNRGVKLRPELYWLRKNKARAILVECCFCDSKEDTSRYKTKDMAAAIVRGLTGQVPQETKYQVILGTFSNKDNADKALLDAKAKGYKDAFVDK